MLKELKEASMTLQKSAFEQAKARLATQIKTLATQNMTEWQYLEQISNDLDTVVRELYKQEVGMYPADMTRNEILQELSARKTPSTYSMSDVTALALTGCIILEAQNGMNSFLRQVISEALNKVRKRRQDLLRLQNRLMQNLGMFYAGDEPDVYEPLADKYRRPSGRRRMI